MRGAIGIRMIIIIMIILIIRIIIRVTILISKPMVILIIIMIISGGPSGANAVVRSGLFDPKDRTAVLSGLELQL